MTTTISKKSLLAAAAGFICGASAWAQSPLPTVSVSGRSADMPAQVGGFGEVPVAKLPMQLSLISSERLLDAGINALSGLTALDASVGDAYNSTGYVSYLKIRGFDLDNRFNYRRDGLPINAETALALGNKASVEILKGSSGIQAGTSSPGGLVNMIVKRPTAQPMTVLCFALSERGTAEAALDWSQRFGEAQAFGLRINAAAAELKPQLRDAEGRSHLLAMAADWRLSPDTLVEAEFELNKQSQPSQPGMSMLGDKLPDAKDFDPHINLNNQSWSQPVVFDNSHASLRVTQKLGADWRAQAHLGVQRLKADDRLAYAYGCTAADGNYYADRYCPDGSFDMYDYRSENERRNSEALDLSLAGKLMTGGITHHINTGVLLSRFNSRFQKQAYNWAGTGTIDGKAITIADPSLTDENTNRDERSNEFYLRDAMQLGASWQAWAGLRHTRLERDSVRTNGSRATSYAQSVTTPWLGLSYAINSQLTAYASWGEGVESEVTPNRKRYGDAAGRALPALTSRQIEAGLKSGSKLVDWSLNWFDISRPKWADLGECSDSKPGSCVRRADGSASHQGLEAQADLKWAGGGLLASAMQLKARREGSADAANNGLRPENVAERSLRLQARHDIAALSGLQLQAGLAYEGPRAVLADNSVFIPGWTRLDAGARLEQAFGRQMLVWRVGVDNLANKRAWKESPFQFGHVYLYPLAPRTFRASLEYHL
ncbi:TonB-dependent siderophore receptor [Roseateles oligotrophus]|uniref:TonB-dependent siderophore receptor n=1 Tax=Roseateles oligotrophus TaxID=1769250 RepID=A0ABT2YJE9_9BURK|nr:TonB-dependent siderophore receptor [Roseateles oligotrophus]MCV2370122.1 TonB-dependent siderophore receptor [Roseateles oligotrophus]